MASGSEIIFYHNPMSRAAMVHWMLEEVGAPYETRLLDFQKGETRTPEFLAVNPMGKLPAIVHGDTVVTEAAAIIAYLADAFPDAGLAPDPASRERGTWYRWLFFTAGCYEPAVLDRMTGRAEPEKAMSGYGSYEEVLGALEKALTPGPYILGDRFSAADVYLGAELWWTMNFGAPGVKENQRFVDYVARVTDRPAFRRVNQGQEFPV
jgi:glutathione S-transferase